MMTAFAEATDATEEARSPYLSVDPAPAMSEALPTTELRALLLDEELDMFQRYAALFSLRNKGGPEEVDAMTAAFKSSRRVRTWAWLVTNERVSQTPSHPRLR
jgi:deoxyhypusine monooxygenase